MGNGLGAIVYPNQAPLSLGLQLARPVCYNARLAGIAGDVTF